MLLSHHSKVKGITWTDLDTQSVNDIFARDCRALGCAQEVESRTVE